MTSVESPRVFISHASADTDFVTRLARDLRLAGIEVNAPEDFLPGTVLAEQIASGLKNADVVLVVLSPSAIESEWVATETAFALAQTAKQPNLRIVPVITQKDSPIPPLLRDKVAVDFSDSRKYNRSLELLTVGLRHQKASEVHSSEKAELELLKAKKMTLDLKIAEAELIRTKLTMFFLHSIVAVVLVILIVTVAASLPFVRRALPDFVTHVLVATSGGASALAALILMLIEMRGGALRRGREK